MSFQLLPVTSDIPNYTFEVDLDGNSYFFDFRWNERASLWIMCIQDVNKNDLIDGVPILCDQSLLAQYDYNAALPPGTLYAYDPTGNDDPPGRTELGNRVRLCYAEVGTT